MKSLKIAMALIVATTLIASCCPCRKAVNKDHKALKTTEWSLVQMDGKNITEQFGTEECPRLVIADDGSFGGYGGCNSMGGQYTLTPSELPAQRDIAGAIHFGDAFSTKRMCPNDRLEMAFFATLAKIDSFTIEGSKLFLFASGELKLVFEAK